MTVNKIMHRLFSNRKKGRPIHENKKHYHYLHYKNNLHDCSHKQASQKGNQNTMTKLCIDCLAIEKRRPIGLFMKAKNTAITYIKIPCCRQPPPPHQKRTQTIT